MKKTIVIVIILGIALNTYSQDSSARKDSIEILLNSISELAIYGTNSKYFDTIGLTKSNFTELEGKFADNVLEIKKTIKFHPVIHGRTGNVDRFTIPIGTISRMILTKDTTAKLTNLRDSYRASLQFFAKSNRKIFGSYMTPLPDGEENGGNTHYVEIFTFVMSDYQKLERMKGLIEYLQANESDILPPVEQGEAAPRLINGIFAYELSDLDEPPLHRKEKDIIDYRNNVRKYVQGNFAITNEDFENLHISIIVGDNGNIIEVLFIDEYFAGTNEEIEKLDSNSRKEYLYYKELFFDKDPNKDIKKQIKEILLDMPKWSPGRLDGINVNTWILI